MHHTTYKFMLNYIIQSSTIINIVYKTSHANISTSQIHIQEFSNLLYNCTNVTNNTQMYEKVYA